MTASYLIRFDDLCPTMRWSTWEPVEETLRELGIRPIVAVIPDNADPSMKIEPARADFWERVRGWQSEGWAIGLHGHRHVYTSADPGWFGWNGRSEFAGHDRPEQEARLRAGLEVFGREGVRPDVWVAPNHAFDATTVSLLSELGIDVISDGLGLHPHRDDGGMLWVPCQLWGFRPRLVGTWTVCLHPNTWRRDDLDRFVRDVSTFRDRIVDLAATIQRYDSRRRSIGDRALLIERRVRRWARRSLRASAGSGPGGGMA